MKNLIILFLLSVMMLATPLPAGAAPVTPPTAVLTVEVLGVVVPDGMVDVKLTASGSDSPLVYWNINIPKTTVRVEPMIVSGAGKLVKSFTSSNYVYLWKEKMGLRNVTTSEVIFRVKLPADYGTYPLISIFDLKGKIVSQKNVVIEKPLLWFTYVPNPVTYGGRDFDFFVNASNTSNTDVAFDFVVNMMFAATDGTSKYPIVDGGVVSVDPFFNPNKFIVYWKGTIPAGKTFTLKLGTASGSALGEFELVNVFDNFIQKQVATSTVVFAEGSGAPYAVMNIRSKMDNLPIKAGDTLIYEPEFYSAKIGQFVSEPTISSNCPMSDLPSGSVSRAKITYVKYLYFVTILPMVKPVGVSDPYTVECKIQVRVHHHGDLGGGDSEFVGEKTFLVLVP